MSKLGILNVVGTRPNMMKIAPIIEVMKASETIEQTLLHTGQHYDENMSQIFFDELGIPAPDIYLGVGSASHAEQTARIMVEFEKILMAQRSDIVLVIGDVNSTLACAITAAKLTVPVVHVEAGLRSYDRTMPEEINRIVADALSDLLLTPSLDANENLRKEGVPEEKITFVGNVMIDTLYKHRSYAKQQKTPQKLGMKPKGYALLTLHRASNVDQQETFGGIIDALIDIATDVPIVFPIHPRTKNRIEEFGLAEKIAAVQNIVLIDPQGYLSFLDLMMHAQLVLTDSGGIQEETTILSVPCLTIRPNTERPITIHQGTNILVGADPERIRSETRKIIKGQVKPQQIPERWDGHAAPRIVNAILRSFG
ncbi:UDP-N-acetylglucosamine 2-epimerase (non-hydrolyzing) [Chloroflexi bacterium TSY]|nr:UDP-N-acetylglucosamine 2-epimerase (non-hydrolyzing) [Chloroflexi bacterium TSY]